MKANRAGGSVPNGSCLGLFTGILILFVFFIVGNLCSAAINSAPLQDSTVVSTDTVSGEDPLKSNPRICINLRKGGKIIIELYPDQAPKAVERILALVKKGFYNGLRFHRVEPYLVQTGKKDIEIEPLIGEMFGEDLKHEVGMVGMARLPDDYDSATTQFYICKKRLPRLNGEYTLFGKVVEGMDLVMKLKKGDKIGTVEIVK